MTEPIGWTQDGLKRLVAAVFGEERTNESIDWVELNVFVTHLGEAGSRLHWEAHAEALRLRYCERFTLQHIGDAFGHTREWARQSKSKSLRMLRHPQNRETWDRAGTSRCPNCHALIRKTEWVTHKNYCDLTDYAGTALFV